MTFTELYKEAVDAPTPRQVFLDKIRQATGQSFYAVRSWAEGTRMPRREMQEKIGTILGMTVDELFPKKRE